MATKKLLQTPEMKGILEVLKSESPQKTVNLPLNAEPGSLARLASLEDGYNICLRKLLSLGTLEQEAQDIEATFEER